MLHWVSTAFSTYVLHTQHGNGYQWWSGPGSDLGQITLIGLAVTMIKHINCSQKGCWRLGHVHPDHGLRICRKHYHHDVVPPTP